MAAVSPSAAYFSPATGVPTPSPFSFSVASSRPSIQNSSLVLRAMELVFSFASSLTLASTMSDNNKHGFQEYTEFIYSFSVTTIVFVYSLCELFKGIRDILCRENFISDRISDYMSFVLDQLGCYLLVSSSSVTSIVIHQQLNENSSLKKAAIVSVSMSVIALLTIDASAILSGYKLSKRIMW